MRASGILLPLSSLPSRYGIGTLGEEAYRFVDFLCAAGQRYWQMLPIGPVGYGDSPYQSFSAFAANPYYIDPDALIDAGLLTRQEADGFFFGSDETKVDYGALYASRFALLQLAADRFDKTQPGYHEFLTQNAAWLPDYALFMALKEAHGMGSFCNWPEPERRREPAALALAKSRLAGRVDFWQICQYLFYTQWDALKRYANQKGVFIIGDIPIYVSPDSSDLWSSPELFQTDAEGRITEVAGCPPDAFSTTGQLWGNPLYRWEAHFADDCDWWTRRLRHAGRVYDVVRIDHFRGFESYWAIPAGDADATGGRWCAGPGLPLIETIKRRLPELFIIAEDLGYQTDSLRKLLEQSGFPGMKVLQFAFDSREESDYLPHNYTSNSVVYTGTHDNTTTADWEKSAPAEDVRHARRYLDLTPERSFAECLIRTALSSVSNTCVIPMQDWLGLGKEARMNTPSTLGGNWQWRLRPDALTPELCAHIRALSRLYGRCTE